MKRCRLIYRSTATAEMVSNAEIKALVEQAAEANRARRITGLLLLSGNRFLQVLEGPYAEVNRLFGTIMADPRHHSVELISFEPLESAYFEEWGMHLADLYDLPAGPRALLAAKYRHKDGVILIPDRLHEVYALLLDARALCLSTPWKDGDAKPGNSTLQM
jgi:hypothetical protein